MTHTPDSTQAQVQALLPELVRRAGRFCRQSGHGPETIAPDRPLYREGLGLDLHRGLRNCPGRVASPWRADQGGGCRERPGLWPLRAWRSTSWPDRYGLSFSVALIFHG